MRCSLYDRGAVRFVGIPQGLSPFFPLLTPLYSCLFAFFMQRDRSRDGILVAELACRSPLRMPTSSL